MSSNVIYCPGGVASQTGVAVNERYTDVSIHDCGKIPDVPPQLATNPGPYVIPIWNSHQGEINAAEYIWNHIEAAKIKITDVWAKGIEFWFVKRVGETTNYRKIGSVVVAGTQCSAFLANNNAELVPCPLTTVALELYRNGAAWDGVLVAPGQCENDPSHSVVERKTANPNNFTSFVRFIAAGGGEDVAVETTSSLTGVSMPAFGASLGETEQSFFDQMMGMVTNLESIPRLIFVFRRTSKVGLLFEGTRLHRGDLVDAEELENGSIAVYDEAGATAKLYVDELRGLCTQNFPQLVNADFVLHRGVSTCLFACPPLGLYTHGFEVETVEPVVRFYISKLFELWDNEVPCTAAQQTFFERYRDAWQERQSAFIQFTVVAAAEQ